MLALSAIIITLLVVTSPCSGGSVPPNGWKTYSFDGSGNRADNIGKAGDALSRFLGYHYSDAESSMLYPTRPDCCALEPYLLAPLGNDIGSLEGLNVATMSFGQFSLSHDVALTPDSTDPHPAPESCTSLHRTKYVQNSSPRDQVNVVTSYIDLSQVYGESPEKGLALRSLVGGKLKVGPGNLPPRGCAKMGVGMSNPIHGVENNQLFCVGDVRGNENIMLIVFHTLFVREHNRLAAELEAEHPEWSDDELFFKARALNIAAYQQITFYEYSRAIMGDKIFNDLIGAYEGHDATARPVVSAEFAQGVYRFTHGQIPEKVLEMVTPSSPKERSLGEFFFVPNELASRGVDPFLHGMLLYPAHEVDGAYAPTLLHFPHLGALDCMRVRDLGLATFEKAREYYGITTPITTVPRKLALLNQYPAGHTDLWAGGMVEEHEVGASFGPVFNAIYAQQMRSLRDGDPLWFESPGYDMLTAEERMAAKETTLAMIIRRNSGIPSDLIPDDAFKMPQFSLNTATTGGIATPPPPPTKTTSESAYHVMSADSSAASPEEVRYLKALTGLTLVVLLVLLASILVLVFLIRKLFIRSPAQGNPTILVPTAGPPVAASARSSQKSSKSFSIDSAILNGMVLEAPSSTTAPAQGTALRSRKITRTKKARSRASSDAVALIPDYEYEYEEIWVTDDDEP